MYLEDHDCERDLQETLIWDRCSSTVVGVYLKVCDWKSDLRHLFSGLEGYDDVSCSVIWNRCSKTLTSWLWLETNGSLLSAIWLKTWIHWPWKSLSWTAQWLGTNVQLFYNCQEQETFFNVSSSMARCINHPLLTKEAVSVSIGFDHILKSIAHVIL